MPKVLVEKHWDNLSGFVATKILPSFAASGGLMESVASSTHVLGGSKSKKQKEDDDDDAESMELYGMTCVQKKEVSNLGLKFMFAEETSGANDEALLCLRKGTESDVGWGICEDYAAFVPKLAEKWKGVSENQDDPPKFRMQAYFASSDVMSGEGGQNYFQHCWEKEKCGDAIEFLGTVVENTSHDNIGFPEKGVLENVLREAKRALEMK